MLAVGATAVLVAVLVLDGPERASLPGQPSSPADTAPDRTSATRLLINELEAAWRRGDLAAVRELADPTRSSRREITDLARNITELELSDFALRYVAESSASAAVAPAADPATVEFGVDVQMTWRIRGMHDSASTLEVPMAMAWDGTDARFVTVRDEAGARVPLWLQERVRVRRTERTLLVTTRRDDTELAGQVEEAWRTVRRTLPDWRGTLVFTAPRTSEEFEVATGMDADSASAIAAITTTADGSSGADSAVQVYLNPPVFDPLGPQGRQIVLSHEATHVAVDALDDAVPHWLSEGFADYVALADTDLPASVLAAQILTLVREDGPPGALPGRVEFDGANEDIGAWYEAAWLAAQLIAERWGEPKLLEFYDRAVDDGEAVAFKQVLGVTKAEFVRTWARHLTELAG